MAILNLGNSNSAFSGSFSGSFKGDGSGLTNILNAQTASFVTLAQTASFVTLAQTASFVATAQTASYIEASNIDGTITSASYALSASYAVSASFEIIKEVSSSYADTASYVENAQTASYVTLAQTASFVTTAQTASYVLNAQTASFVTTAQTASYVLNAQTASFVTTAQTASYVLNAVSSSYALSSSFALTASHALNTTNAKYLVYQTGSGTDSIKPVAGSNTASGPYASIGGGCSNILRNSGSFIGGGKNNEICNGGFNNNCGKYGTIGGGLSNTNNSYAGTIAGGNLNTVSNAYATVAGGKSNCAASRGVVAGGTDNNASGNTSGILGGRNNTANANCSFIIGSSISSTVSNHTHVNNLTTAGNITGSNISASGYISASSFNATPNVVNQLTASHALTASYALGADGFPFSGNAVITGSLLVSGSFVNFIDAPLTASIISASGGITGSLLGTASTASYVEIAQTASYVTTAQTASFVLNAISSSYALTASYAVSASHEIIKEISSSYADTASYVETAQTASYVLNAQTASFVTLAQTASYVETAQTASYVLNANNATDLVVQVKNTQTSTILKGQVLHSVGVTGEVIDVITASNDSATSMPGFAVANQDINSNAAGQAIISGKIKNIDTSGLTAGSNVYVNLNGDYTGTKPTGSSLIQNIGVVGKVNATEGELIILGAGRSNDVPNISPGYIWIGNSDSVATPTATSSIQNVVSSSYASTASYVETAQTASYVTLAQTASYVTTAQTASYVLNAVSSSYALTASYAVSASHEIIKEISSSYADTASYVETSQTASYILTSNIDQPFTDITASGNISASGIINGLSGSFKSLDVFVNLPITTGSKFRVGRMDSQFIGFGVSDYDNIILAKQDTDSNLPHNFILDRDFEGTGANNFKIQKNGIDQFVIDTSGNITASGDISASGYISASEFVGLITTAQTASYILASNIDQPFTNITASGNISASGGNIFGNVFNADTYVITPNVGRTTTTLVEFGNGSSTHSNEDTDIVLKTQGSGEVIVDIGGNDVIKFLQDDIAIGKPFRGLTIASGSWGYGDLIVSGSINAKGPTGNITASGNISASGDVITQKIGIVDGAGIGFGANFASGNEASDVQIFTDAAGEINFVKNSTTVLAINSGNNISINPSYFLDQPLNITNNITASGNISASGYISASNLGISGSATIDGPLTLTQANTLSPLTINNGTGTEIYFPGTTETNIKSEGLFQFKTSNNQGYGFGVNNVDFKAIIGAEGLATTATTVIADTYNGRLILRGNASPNQITGSIAMTGSAGVEAFISASSFNATPGTINELTASYAMTASTAESILPSINFKPVVTHTSNFTSTSSYAGHYNIVGGTLAITVTTGSTPTDLTPGMEWDFFQTSSGDSFTFTEGTGVEIISRNNQKKLTDLGSAGTLKYISGQTFHLIGDLTI
jgi:hypothetical protein